MCGRTACALAPEDICRASKYQSKDGKVGKPAWKDAPGGKKYYPSHNIAPGSHTPVMLSCRHYPQGEFDEGVERVIQPMKWGLVPSWHKGDPYKIEYETNNCRSEGMITKRTYKVPLEKGRRCVILADGFFEWKRTKESKQPYFIYFPESNTSQMKTEQDSISDTFKQEEKLKKEITEDIGVKKVPLKIEIGPSRTIEPCDTFDQSATGSDIKTESSTLKQEEDCITTELGGDTDVEEEWKGKKLLTVAGVFEIWKPPDMNYIPTVDSSPAMAWIHHRMPAVLSDDKDIDEWLDFSHVPLSKATKLIRPTETITMHPVSSIVNNSRNKSPECVIKINPQKPKKCASSSFMMSWLGKGKQEKDGVEPPVKRSKTQ